VVVLCSILLFGRVLFSSSKSAKLSNDSKSFWGTIFGFWVTISVFLGRRSRDERAFRDWFVARRDGQLGICHVDERRSRGASCLPVLFSQVHTFGGMEVESGNKSVCPGKGTGPNQERGEKCPFAHLAEFSLFSGKLGETVFNIPRRSIRRRSNCRCSNRRCSNRRCSSRCRNRCLPSCPLPPLARRCSRRVCR
jgi:hypothetical protein